jgi:hypothetical protein
MNQLSRKWEPQRLTTLWTFMACYRDSFIFLYISLLSTFRQKDKRYSETYFCSLHLTTCKLATWQWFHVASVVKMATVRNGRIVELSVRNNVTPLTAKPLCPHKDLAFTLAIVFPNLWSPSRTLSHPCTLYVFSIFILKSFWPPMWSRGSGVYSVPNLN